MNIVHEFSTIRDIPYRIPLALHENNTCCSGKVAKLKSILDAHGLTTIYRVCEFRWSDLPLPKEVLEEPHEDVSTHVYLEVLIDENWIHIDPTWDSGLRSILPISEWDGKHSTQIAVRPTKVYSEEESKKIMMGEDPVAFETDMKTSGRFYKALNLYFEKVRTQLK